MTSFKKIYFSTRDFILSCLYFFKEYYYLFKNLFWKVISPFKKPYFFLFFIVTLLSAFPILISWYTPKIVNDNIGEPYFSILSFAVVLIITSGLYIISDEYYKLTKESKNHSNLGDTPIYKNEEYGNLFWGFTLLILPIFCVVFVPFLISIDKWNGISSTFSWTFFVISILSWILSNGNIGEKFDEIVSEKSKKTEATREMNDEILRETGHYGFRITS